jgi:glycosyltransferase involved in cell wall biosynthesis
MRVLHVIHDFLPRHQAGSEIYAYELCRQLAALGIEVHVLCAEYDPTRAHGSLAWRWHDGLPVTELINNWSFASFAETYSSPALTAQIEHVINAVQPDVVHIHNLLNLSFELPAVARARGIPSVATLHEYVLLCPSGGQRVHLAEEHVCFDIEPERCARCFASSPFYSQMVFGSLSQGGRGVGRIAAALRRRFPALVSRAGRVAAAHVPRTEITVDDIRGRLAAAREVFDTVDLFVAPSPALGAELERFGLPASKLRVSDYGFVPLPKVARAPGRDRLRVGFVGTLVWHKGVHVLVEALSRLPRDSYQAMIFGSLDTFPDYTAELEQRIAELPIELRGGFDRARVAEVYAEMDMLIVSSLWPENSPLVIHEAFMAGVPVIGSRLGGTVDLIEDGVSGLLYEPFSAADLAAKLKRLLDEPGLLERLATALPPVKTIADDAAEWVRVYEELHTPS